MQEKNSPEIRPPETREDIYEAGKDQMSEASGPMSAPAFLTSDFGPRTSALRSPLPALRFFSVLFFRSLLPRSPLMPTEKPIAN